MDILKSIKNSKPAYDRRTRHKARKKALEVIEEISVHNMGMCETDEEKEWATIYTFVHVSLGNCGNPHEEWEKELNDTWQELRGHK